MQYFFSVIIPAYNEEKYITKSLSFLRDQNYPTDCFEVLVVENGSQDKTFDVVSCFKLENLRVLRSEKGVSRAKNFGIRNISEKTHWIVFLDADTYLKPDFLTDLNEYFNAFKGVNLSIGTTKVLPEGNTSLYARLWFAFYNLSHRTFHVSFSIQIMNASYRNDVKFDENRKFSEDLTLIKDLKKFGKFFFFNTKQVLTSTRRFDEVGWFTLLFKWLWQSLVLSKSSKKAGGEYGAIR